MKTNKVIAGLLPCVSLLSAAWVLAASDVEDRLTKSFEAKPGGKLVVEADRGSIEVKSADADQVQIEVFRKVSRESQAKAEEILKNHEVRFSLDGNKVQVHAEFKKGFTGGWGDKGRNLQVRYQILHRCAASVIEAKRYGFRHAVFVVQAFDTPANSFQDYVVFCQALKIPAARQRMATTFVDGISLSVGWADCPLATHEEVAATA